MKDVMISSPGLALSGITCLFGRTPAVRGIDLGVLKGEFLALVGPSGAGKTTLLRIIAGLEPNHSGSLRIGRRDVTDIPARQRNIGFVFQSYALFAHMSVAENVAFGLRVRPRRRRPHRAVIAARVRELLELVQVGDLAARRFPAASGSVWRWPAHWLSNPSCCCSTSRSAPSIRWCARKSAPGCAGCMTGSA